MNEYGAMEPYITKSWKFDGLGVYVNGRQITIVGKTGLGHVIHSQQALSLDFKWQICSHGK